MVSKEEIDRINFLARKAKSETLTPEEKEEQLLLRRKYIDSVRSSLKCQLDNIKIVDE